MTATPLCLFAGLLLSFSALAQAPAAPAPAPATPAPAPAPAAEPSPEELNKAIDEAALAHLDQQITLEATATALKLAWPLPQTPVQTQILDEKVTKLLTEQVDKELPVLQRTHATTEAGLKYRLYKAGDQAEITIRGTLISGRFKGINRQRQIEIDFQKINAIDLNAEDQARFYPDVNKKMIDKAVDTAIMANRNHRNNLIEKYRPGIKSSVFTEAGYIELNGKWYSAYAYVDSRRKQNIQASLPEGRKAVEPAVRQSCGYQLIEGAYVHASLLSVVDDFDKPARTLGYDELAAPARRAAAVLPPDLSQLPGTAHYDPTF